MQRRWMRRHRGWAERWMTDYYYRILATDLRVGRKVRF